MSNIMFFSISLPFLFALVVTMLIGVLTAAQRLHNNNKNKNNKRKKKSPAATAAQLPPGPKGWPLVGCLPQILRNNPPAFRWIHNFMVKSNTDIARIRLGSVNVIAVSSPDLARDICRSSDFLSRPRCVSASMISNGYLTSIFLPVNDDQWTKMRRILTSHVLSPAAIRAHYDKRMEEANHLVLSIYTQCTRENAAGGGVNLRAITRGYAGNIAKRVLLGCGGTEDEELVEAMFTILRYVFGFGVADYVPWLGIFDIDGHQRIIKRAISVTAKHFDAEVDKRIQMWKDGRRTVENDVVDALIMLKGNNGRPLLTHEEIKTQVVEMILAAVDNASNAAEWAMAEMMSKPELMKRAVEEVDGVVGSERRFVQESDLPKLNYIKACLKEAFRLHPVGPFTPPRESTADAIVGGYFIPKGSQVILNRIGIGRDARTWEEPLEFRPERHLGQGEEEAVEVALTDPEMKLVSFSAGRRGCPAGKLGTLMATMLLARLVHSFTWSPPPGSSRIDLSEAEDALFLQTPLHAVAKPRLDPDLYNNLMN